MAKSHQYSTSPIWICDLVRPGVSLVDKLVSNVRALVNYALIDMLIRYLSSTQGFNALVGSTLVFFYLSYGKRPAQENCGAYQQTYHTWNKHVRNCDAFHAPARDTPKKNRSRYDLGKFAYPICIVVVIYTVLPAIFVMVSSTKLSASLFNSDTELIILLNA